MGEISRRHAPSAKMRATQALLKRSTWKGPNLVPLPIVWPKTADEKVPPVRTKARSATILPSFVGLRFEIHNGKIYNSVKITEDMVGHKLGEFSQTRRGISQRERWRS